MRKLLMLLALVVGLLGSGGCRDSGTGPTPLAEPGPAFAASSAALAALGPGWRTAADDPYACFVSTATASGPIAYKHRRIPLRFPAGMRGKDGAVASFRYRMARADGRALRVLNCVIPATRPAQRALAHRINLPAAAPEQDGIFVMSCPEGCLPPFEWGACQGGPDWASYPECEQPVADPCDYGFCEPVTSPGGGAFNPIPLPPTDPQPGGGSSGGPSACANCGPNAPVLTCPAVTRGSNVRCTVNAGDLDVQGWTFSDAGSGTSIRGPLGVAEWSGPAVRSGTVNVFLASGNVAQAALVVEPRGWKWGQPGEWSFIRQDDPLCFNKIPSAGDLLGWNTQQGTCAPALRVQPDPSKSGVAFGFAAATATGGPNAGMHYVVSAHFAMNRRWAINPQILPGGTRQLLSGWQATKCGYQRNLYEFNVCMGVDMSAFLAGIESHEGMGTLGNNGHEGAARSFAADPGNDPMVACDLLYGPDGETLAAFSDRVREDVYNRGYAITNYAADHAHTSGNWSGKFWLWDRWSREFVETAQQTM